MEINKNLYANSFEKELFKPLSDLLSHITHNQNITKAVDIGCGTGTSTEWLVKLFPNATISGIDISSEMISIAKKRLPMINLEVDNISHWKNLENYDLIFANSVLHWVPDHKKLLPMLISKLVPGGTLAIQFPDNSNEPALKLMDTISQHPNLAHRFFDSSKTDPRHSPEKYYQILKDKVSKIDIWRTIYYHVIPGGTNGLIEWFYLFGLKRLLNSCTEGEKKYFLEHYKQGLAKHYHIENDGRVFLPFPRIFILAVK